MMRASRRTEVRDIAARTVQITPERNHAAVCAVLKWAKRTPGVVGDDIGDMCTALGLNVLEAVVYGHQKARQQ